MNNKKRILLVEDDPNFGIILRDFLKMNEYDVILAKNGMEGFEKFKKFEFNLCILDVMMPYKDGFTLATEIKSVSPDIPIIFLTAKSMKEDVLKGYKVGADDYLKKPFDSDVLLFKIKAILKRNKLSSVIDSEETEFNFSSFCKVSFVVFLITSAFIPFHVEFFILLSLSTGPIFFLVKSPKPSKTLKYFIKADIINTTAKPTNINLFLSLIILRYITTLSKAFLLIFTIYYIKLFLFDIIFKI